MKLDNALVHLFPLVNSYKGRDYFSAFVFYSANLKDVADFRRSTHRRNSRVPSGRKHSAKPTAASVSNAAKSLRILRRLREIISQRGVKVTFKVRANADAV